MNWDDGIRKILKPVGSGFLIYEYRPGRPIDGVPTRIFSATPENVSKLAKYMEGQKEVAMELFNLAKDASFIIATKEGSWGQEIVSWAWPFKDNNKNAQVSNTYIQSDSQSSQKLDPWWWPFWSENPSVEATAFDSEHYSAEIVTNLETTRKTNPDKPVQPTWAWPF